ISSRRVVSSRWIASATKDGPPRRDATLDETRPGSMGQRGCHMRRFAVVGFGVLVGLGIGSAAEPLPDRYALGQRLRAFERAWTAQPDPAARKRTVAVLKRAVPLFFAGRVAEVASTVDQSRA